MLALGAAAVAWPLRLQAQQPSGIPRIGFLRFGPAAANAGRVEALRAGLRQLGYIEGKTIVIDFGWAETVDQLPELAAALVRTQVDVIFAMSSTEAEAARQVTRTIPIVFATHADPVGVGHVASLPQPGGNITGLTVILTDLVAKQLEILKETVPQATRIGVLFSPTAPSHRPATQALEIAATALGVQLVMVPARTADDFEPGFSTMLRERVGGFVAVSAPLLNITYRQQLAELALKHRLPAMFASKENVEAGGLMGYGPHLNDLVQRAAAYIDKILKGAKPADLPVEQASRYELVINLKTARVLGLEIPPPVLARTDEVIE